jgi:hypothetical protein
VYFLFECLDEMRRGEAATGALGIEMRRCLEVRGFPINELALSAHPDEKGDAVEFAEKVGSKRRMRVRHRYFYCGRPAIERGSAERRADRRV